MELPYSWGRPTEAAGVYGLGGGDWEIAWSPQQIHPYAAQWLEWSTHYGPPSRLAPPQDLWAFAFQTKHTIR